MWLSTAQHLAADTLVLKHQRQVINTHIDVRAYFTLTPVVLQVNYLTTEFHGILHTGR